MQYLYFPKLTELRVEAELSIAALEKLSSVSTSTIRRIEKGGRCTKIKALAIINALNTYHYNASSIGPISESKALLADPNNPGPR